MSKVIVQTPHMAADPYFTVCGLEDNQYETLCGRDLRKTDTAYNIHTDSTPVEISCAGCRKQLGHAIISD